MPFFSWTHWLRSLYRTRRQPARRRKRPTTRLTLEGLEDRTLLATLPAPLVSNQVALTTNFGTASDHPLIGAQVAIDPTNANNLVAAASYNPVSTTLFDAGLRFWTSTDAGATWSNPVSEANQLDPLLFSSTSAVTRFTKNEDVSLSFDRLGHFYIVSSQHNDLNTSGAIVFSKYTFGSSSNTNNILYRWGAQDQAFNPVIGIDTNLPTFTDPLTGKTQTDSMANSILDGSGNLVPKAIYVAWNTNFTQPTGSNPATLSRIWVSASGNGGTTFSTTEFVSGSSSPAASPQIAFTQGSADGAVPGGRLMFFWSGSSSSTNVLYNKIMMDSSSPDSGLPAGPAAVAQIFTNNTGGVIYDATTVAQTTNGSVATITVTNGGGVANGGTDYTSAPTVTIDLPSTPGGVRATATATIAGGVVTAITLTNGGSGYTTATPGVTITGGGGTGAAATATANVRLVAPVETTVNITAPNFGTLADLDVTLSLEHPRLSDLSVRLTSPTGTTITLIANAALPAAGVNMGVVLGGNPVSTHDLAGYPYYGTVLDDDGQRPINDVNIPSPYIGHFRPSNSMSSFLGATAASASGIWRLELIDSANGPGGTMRLHGWSLNFTSVISTSRFGTDAPLPTTYSDAANNSATTLSGGTGAPQGVNNTYQLTGPLVGGTPGIGPGISVAVDNSLGSFSPNQGNIYVAYTGYRSRTSLLANANDTDVFLMRSTDGGANWILPSQDLAGNRIPVNDDLRLNPDTHILQPADDFSEGNRTQFMPNVVVDPITGTVVVTYYDGRWDAALVRASNYIATSIDGGITFGAQTFVNQPKTALDAIDTSKLITIEPIPGNQGQAGPLGFGDRQGLAAYAGRIYPAFAGNLNAATSRIFVPTVVTAAGPRIIQGEMGPILADATTPNGGITYDNTFTADGTRRLDGFTVSFDRPIDPATFGPNDITLQYMNPAGVLTDLSNSILSVTALDAGLSQGPRDPGTSPTISVSDGIVVEGNSGARQAVFTVILSMLRATDTTVTYSTSNGSATAGADYTAATGTVTIPAGQTSATFTVDVLGDVLVEGNETFSVSLSGAPVPIGRGTGTCTIVDDEDIPVITVSNGIIREGDTGTVNMTFTAILSVASATTVTTQWATASGTAISGTDFNSASGTVTFPIGNTSQTFTVAVRGDRLTEGNETFVVNLTNPVRATLSRTQVTGIIVDNDALGVSIGNAAVRENTDATVVIPVTLNALTTQTVTVNYTTAPGSASAGSDYTTTSGSVTILPGTWSANIVVPIVGNTTVEPTESFFVNLTGSTNASIYAAQATVTILDDDTLPTLTIGDAILREGDTGSANVNVPLVLSYSLPTDLTVNYSFGGGSDTATAGTDYTATGTLVIIPAGSTTFSIPVPIVGDTIKEPNEVFTVTLGSLTGTTVPTIARAAAKVKIVDNEVGISIGDTSVLESVGGGTVTARVVLDSPSSSTITVQLDTLDNTATTAGGDYNAVVGTIVTFLPGVTFQNITLNNLVINEATAESNESFFLVLSNPTNAVLTRSQGTVTIVDEDTTGAIFWTMGDASIQEGASGTATLALTYFTTGTAPAGTETGTFTTANNTATAGSDFTTTSATVTLTAGQRTGTINVPILGDLTPESNETFFVNFTAVSAGITLRPGSTATNGQGVGLIFEDDQRNVSLITQVAKREGDTGSSSMGFDVVLSNSSTTATTLTFTTTDGTAIAPTDYTAATAATLNLAANVATGTFNVSVAGDKTVENAENFSLTLNTASSNLVIDSALATGTIVDDDALTASIGDITLREGTGGTTNAIFTVYLNALTGTAVTVNYATANGTAQAGSDYTTKTGTLTIPAGSASATISVVVNPDALNEANETFTLTISSPSANVNIVRATATALLLNDDLTPALTIGDAIAAEGNSGSAAADFVVYSSFPIATDITYNYSTSNGTAVAPGDYTAVTAASDQIFAGFTNGFAFSNVVGDTAQEGNETYQVTLSNASNGATFARGSGTALIVDDDGAPRLAISDVLVKEGDNSNTTVTFTVLLSSPSSQDVTVQWSTADGTALGGLDFIAAGGTVTIPATQMSGTFTVDVAGDSVQEALETFRVNLSNAVGATIGKSVGTVTIVDDDGAIGATQFFVRFAPRSAAGTYRYAINSTINDRMRDPNSVIGGGGGVTTNPYASSVFAFSSEYNSSPGTYSAFRATGAPNVSTYSDNINAWAAFNADGPPNPEYLDLRYSTPVFATGVVVRETYNSGFVTQIDLVDTTNVYHTVFGPGGIDPSSNNAIANFTVNFPMTSYLVKGVKVYVNPVGGSFLYEEIDSVQLLGTSALTTYTASGISNTNLPLPPLGTGGAFPVGTFPPPSNDDTAVSSIDVAGLTSPLTDVNVTVQIDYPVSGDLELRLVAPNGAAIVLANQRPTPGAGGNYFLNTTFDDQAANSFATATTPYTTVRSDSFAGAGTGLATYVGMSAAVANGTWTLQVKDDQAANVGTLVGWSLTFNSIGAVAPSGNFMDQNANAVTNQGAGTGDQFAIPTSKSGIPFQLPYAAETLPLILPGPHVVATSVPNNPPSTDNRVINGTNNAMDVTFDRDILVSTFTPDSLLQIIGPSGAIPLPAGSVAITALSPSGSPQRARSFRITFPPQALSGTYQLLFSPNVNGTPITDVNGNGIDTNVNAGLDVLRGASSVPGSVKVQYNASAIPVTLGAGQTINAPLSVADSYVIQQSASKHIQVQLKITHQNIPDLEAQLIAPDGTIIQLFRNVGTFGTNPHANMNDTILDDFATIPIQNSGTPIGPGPFNPQLPLSTLDGHGANGTWKLSITNHGTFSGTLNNWSLFLPKSTPSTGLGELIADQFSPHFRIFTQDPANSLTTNSWTAVGPAAENVDENSGRIGGLALDPSDPSGNTVFVAGASGGIWKTTNFLTTDPIGPTYVPLTDFGPGFSLNTGSMAVFGRSNDPNQTIVFVATGEGDVNSQGVGFLRSMDGGKTWQVLDSTNNIDVANPANPLDPDKIAKMSSPARDHIFVGSTAFKVIVDPTPLANGQVAVYAALNGTAANRGIWRSVDTGKTWSRIRAGNATDVALAAGGQNANGNLDKLYAAFRGEGVYFTPSAISAGTMSLMTGGGGSLLRFDVDGVSPTPIGVSNPSSTPNGNFGRILLAVPALTNNPLRDAVYQGWVYALVVSTTSSLQGLYLTKDFGGNWTKVLIPGYLPTATSAFGTNDETKADYDPFARPASGFAGQGNYDVSFAIDPNNPNIVYIGGTVDGPPVGMMRVDATTVADPFALVPYDNSDAGTGPVQFTTNTGPITIKAGGTSQTTGLTLGVGREFGILDATASPRPGAPINTNAGGYFNLLRDPDAPFFTPSSLQFTNVANFNNTGKNATWHDIGEPLERTTDQHELITFRDPLTGQTRLIFGDDQGVFTGVDRGDGTFVKSVGTAPMSFGSRNGNLQIIQFYFGAVQPSTLAADIAGALFYGNSQDDGFPISSADIIHTGDLSWTGPEGDGTGIATDQTGSGSYYTYRWPCCGAGPLASDFFLVSPNGGPLISRMGGPGASLLQPGDNPKTGAGQWPFLGGANFAVNPIDGRGLLISGMSGGIIYRTTDMGLNWFKIGNTANGDLDGTYAPALAFGAPRSAIPGVTNDFIYAGTTGGKIFVTFNGGGVGQWRDISAGLAGTPQVIVPNPRPDSREAYAVTNSGVYWMQDSSAATPTWVKLNDTAGQGSLYNLNLTVFGNQGDTWPILQLNSLTSLAVDWRWAIPDAVATHPVLYVAGEGGVLRSTDKGVTWKAFPAGTNEQQTITIPSTVTSLTFNYNGVAAMPLTFSPATTALQVQTNLQTIAALNGNVSVAGPTGGPYVVTFINQLGVIDVIPLTVTGIVPGGNISVVETTRGVPVGGYMPNVHVSDLDLVLGNILPSTGFPDESAGLNMLVATTYGRGTFAIRMDNSSYSQFAVTPRSGPRVLSALPGTNAIGVTFSGPVDSASITLADVTLNEQQTITVTNPVTSLRLSYNGTAAAASMPYSAATTAGEIQDHLKTIPALITNEQQSVNIPSSVSNVIFSFNGVAATPLVFSPATTAAQFRTNLETIPALSGNVAVAGAIGGPFVVTFNNAIAGKDVPLLTSNNVAVAVFEAVPGGPNFQVSGAAGGPYRVTFRNLLSGQDVALLIPVWTGAGNVNVVQSLQGGTLGLLNPSGNPISLASITETSSGTPNPHNTFNLNLVTPPAPGFYSFVLGPMLSDFSGNRMDQNQNLVGGEISSDMYSARVLIQSFANQRPGLNPQILTPNPDPIFPSIVEDSFNNAGVDLASWFAGLPGGGMSDPNDPSYAPGVAPRGIAVTSVDNTFGQWQYAINAFDSNPFWFNFGTPTAAAARLLEVADTTRIRFVPNANFNSTFPGSLVNFTFQAWDLTSGTAGGIGDASSGLGTSISLGTAARAVITVTAVNDAPVNTVPGAQTVAEETARIFSTANGNRIRVSDVDDADNAVAGDELVQVTLSTPNGTLTLNGTAGLSFSFSDANGVGAGDGTADATMTFRGTIANVNAALDGMSFTGSLNFVGATSVSITTNDLGNFPSGALTDSDTIAITVTAVNDAPVNSVPGGQTTAEETALVFDIANSNPIQIGDVDDADNVTLGDEPVQVTLTATNGTLTLSGIAGLSFSFSDANGTGAGDGTADATMTFRGTMADVNAALLGMRFVPTLNFVGAASVTILTNDRGNFGAGIPLTDSDSVAITVTAVNDAPVNTVPAAQSTPEETPRVFNTANGNLIAVGDVDDADNAVVGDESVQVTLSAVNGVLSLSGTTGLSFSFSDANGTGAGDGTADATMTFRGTLADVNAALNGSSFLAPLDFTGAASVTIVSNDLGNFGAGSPLTDSDTIAITVTQVNDAPVNSVPSSQTTAEETPLVFSTGNGNRISVGDIDDADNVTLGDEPVQVTLSATNGTLTLSGIAGLSFAFSDANGTGAGDGTADATMTFRGTLANVNAALDGLSYTGALNFVGAATVTILSNDLGNFGTGGAKTDTDFVTVTVTAVNDAPVNTIPGAQTTPEETPRVFNTANGNLIAVGDVDDADNAVVGDESVQVTLSAVNGVLSLSGTTGLSFSFSDANGTGAGDGTADATMTFRGTLADVNAALNGASFLAPLDFTGAASVTIVSNDLGNFGAGSPLTDSDTIAITVTQVNDAPVNTTPAAQTVAEETPLVFSTANANRILVSDVDDADNAIAGDEPVQVTLTATNGVMSLNGTAGLSFSFSDANGAGVGDGTADATMTFRGTLANVNAALDGLSFTGALNFVGAASVTIVSNDLGNFGTGGAKTDTDVIAVTVTAVNDAPVNTVPVAQSTPEETPLVFNTANGNRISVSDVDDADNAIPSDEPVQVTLSAVNGVLSLSGTTGLSFSFSDANGTGAGDGTADATMTFRGTLADVNAALNGSSFLAPLDFTGATSVTIVSNDLGNFGAGSPLTDSDTVAITVTQVNDAPANTTPATQTVAEETALVFSTANTNRIFVGDVDDADNAIPGDEPIQVTLTATNGVLSLNGIAGLSFSFSDANGTGAGDGTADATMTFRGTLANVNAALDGLSYTGALNFVGAATVTILSNDLGNFGTGGAKTDTDVIAVTVTAVNDAPVNSVPGAQSTPEVTPLVFNTANGNRISVSDVDDADNAISGDEPVQVTLSAVNGVLTLSGTTGLSFSFSDANGVGAGDGTADATMTFRGTLADVNAALNGSSFLASPSFTGAASVTIVSNDLGNFGAGSPLTDSDTVAITVTGVNDAPVNTVPAAQTTAEETALVFSTGNSNRISVGDIDDADNAIVGDETVQVTLSATSGTLTLSGIAGLSFSFTDANGTGAGDGTADATMTFRGALANVNTALLGMSFTPTLNYVGAANVTVISNDLGNFGAGGALTDSDAVAITVTPVNDAPVNTVPAAQSTPEETPRVFSTANGNRISVGDVDDLDNAVVGDEPVQVTLTAVNGVLSLSGTTGLSFSFSDANGIGAGDGTADAAMTFRGTLAAVNAALNGLSFLSPLNFTGAAGVTIVSNDLGNFGAGSPLTDSDTVAITVTQVNDAPVNIVPAIQTTLEETPLVFSTGNGNRISVGDVDDADNAIVGDETVQVTLSTASGTLTLSTTAGLRFSFSDANGTGAGTGTNDAAMTFRGSLNSVNAALDGLSFTPSMIFAASVTITTNDLGNFGTGGAKTDTDIAVVNVLPVNDAPVNTAPGPQTNPEDTPLIFSAAAGNRIAVDDVDDTDNGIVGDEQVQVALTATHGTLTLSTIAGLSFSFTDANGTGAGDGAADPTMTFRGTLNSVNVALNGMRFTNTLNYVGAANVTITSNDLGNFGVGTPLTDSDGVAITVTAVNDAPVNTVPGPQTTAEDTNRVFSAAAGNRIAVGDVDDADNAVIGDEIVQVTLGAANGVLTLAGTSGLTFAFSDANGTGAGDGTADATMTFRGTLSAVNAALDGLFFRSPLNFNGAAGVTIQSNDLGTNGTGGPLSDSDTLAITVTQVNDAPVNAAPVAVQTLVEDTNLVFSAANSNRISTNDADDADNAVAGDEMVQVTLIAPNGVLTLSVVTGLGFSFSDANGTGAGDGTNDPLMTFRGSLTNVNNALNGLRFNPTLNFVGATSVVITTNDLGNFGTGGALTDTDTVNLTVTAVNDAPVHTAPAAQNALEDVSLVFSTANGNRIAVGDVDDADDGTLGNEVVQVTLSAVNGALTLNGAAGLSFSFSDANGTGAGDGTADAAMTFRGSLASVNAALQGMSFLSPQDYNGPAGVTIVSNDLGNFGTGTPLSDSDSIAVTVTPVNDAPTFNLPANPPVIAQGDGAQTVLNFTNSTSVGPADESSQTLTGFTVALAGTTGSMAFIAAPSIDLLTGTLTYQATATSLGTATFNVTLADNGPNAPPPNVNTSVIHPFTIIIRLPSVMTLTPTPANPKHGQPVTLAIEITGSPGGPPTGTVTISDTFNNVTTVLQSNVALSGGAVNANLGLLANGAHNLTVDYSGDLNFATNTKSLSLVVGPATTSTTVGSAAANPSPFGAAVTFTAVVSVTSGGTPSTISGNVIFGNGNVVIGTVTAPTSTTATTATYNFTYSGLSVNQTTGHTIVAIFLGSDPANPTTQNFAASPVSNFLMWKVAPASTAITSVVAASPSPSQYGQPVTFTATVVATNSPLVPNGGTVTFRDGANVIGVGTVNASGQATFTTTATQLAVGNHSITAIYGGSPNFAASAASPATTQTVNAAMTQTTLVSSHPGGSTYGNAVTFTATVNATSGNPGTPGGYILFFDGANNLGAIPMTNGSASITVSNMNAGSHLMQAYYAPSTSSFVSTASPRITQNVAAASTSTTLRASVSYWAVNQPITFTATVATTSGGTPGTPTGSVQFNIDGNLTTVPLSNNTASLTFTFTTMGNHTVTATYLPTTAPVQNFQTSSSAAQTQNVRKPAAVALSSASDPNTVALGALVSTTATGGPPTGTVTFYEYFSSNNTYVPINTATLGNGKAVIFADLAPGDHVIVVVYSGDANFTPAVTVGIVSGKTGGRVV